MSLVFEKFRYTLTIDLINNRLLNMMRRDPLTKVNNRVAYEDKEKYLHSQIVADPDIEFAIAMFDVNNLKLINDSKGHEAGDEYLLRACRLICNVFKHSPVFRIGGDEFVAVLSGEDYDNREALMTKINDQMSPYQNTLPMPPDYVSIACGLSTFDSKTDTSAADVAKRADEAMYKDKTAKKASAYT
jgi:diguanylate cyclase (GGDEF)-like protein